MPYNAGICFSAIKTPRRLTKSGPIGSYFNQDTDQDIIWRSRITGQVVRVSPTPANPSKRIIPPIIPATIITYLFSL
jgi:hypothetical protein